MECLKYHLIGKISYKKSRYTSSVNPIGTKSPTQSVKDLDHRTKTNFAELMCLGHLGNHRKGLSKCGARESVGLNFVPHPHKLLEKLSNVTEN
jgi:hypothetical protein